MRVRNGHLVVIGAERYEEGKLVIGMEPVFRTSSAASLRASLYFSLAPPGFPGATRKYRPRDNLRRAATS
jgi:hypothetical protein